MPRVAASIKALTQIKDVDAAQAKRIRAIWHAVRMDDLLALYPNRRAEIIDRLNVPGVKYRQVSRVLVEEKLGTCGLEYLGQHKRTGKHIYYCNTGDTYAATILFVEGRMYVGCWGDLVEKNLINEPAAFF